jgi:capsular exopolysaccharide synthesis family protein
MQAASAAVSPGPEPVEEVVSLRQLLLILGRHWRLLLLIWGATLAATAVWTYTTKPLYRPQVTLEIRPETPLVPSEANDQAAMASWALWESYYRTQEAILTSPSLLESTLKALPESIRRDYDGLVDPAASIAGRVQIGKTRSSFIMTVGFVDGDAKKATQIVNALVQVYLEEVNRRLRETKSGAAELLSKETLPAIRLAVDEADKAREAFLAENGFIDPQEQYQALLDSRRAVLARLTEIRLKQIQVRSVLETLQGYAADGLSGVYNPAFHSTKLLELLTQQLEQLEGELSKARQELKDEHPTVLELKEQIRRVEAKVRTAVHGTLKSLGSDLVATEREERAAEEERTRIEKEMADAAQRVARYRRLDAELATARELYNSYLKKHGETTATSGAGLGSVRVIDHATVPQSPWKPNIPLNLGLGALLGLMLGAGAMFATEQLNDRILSPKEVEVFVKLGVLSVIPKMRREKPEGDRPLLLNDASSLVEYEAFRGLRAELVTRLEKTSGPKVVAILSSMSSEGKSTISVNLAKVLALEGRRVLIFDADMRRPTMQPEYGADSGPGLERVLSGEVPLESAILPSKIPGVDLLGMRRGTDKAAEIASSKEFEEIFRRCRERYEYLILDSAPVNQVSEAVLLARRADVAVLVVRERQTGRGAAVSARQRLQSMGVPLAGVVYNFATGRGQGYGYGYGYYYGYGYGYGYGDREKKG